MEETRETTELTIRLFGRFSVSINNVPLPKMHSRKDYLLLALLVLQQGHEVRRAELARTLWPFPDHSTDQGAAYLRKSLWELRRALGAHAYRLQSPSQSAVRFDLAGASVDLLDFDAAISRGDPESLEVAVDLYRGSLLTDGTEAWIEEERERRALAYQQALQTLSERAGDTGDYETALSYLRRARAVNPFREPVRRAIMEMQARSGHYNEAALEYQDLRDLLRHERASSPSQETHELYNRLREEARRTAQPSDRPFGKPSPDPARSSEQAALPRSLPRPLTVLLGREAAVREIVARLRRERLVTLTGTGGVGKTRLAMQTAVETADAFADGACFVELAAVVDPLRVPHAVAAAMGLREDPARSIRETLQSYLSRRSILLILDNCEHLIEPCAQFAGGMLTECPELKILATSRQPLGVTGEITWRVPSLPLPDAKRHPAPGAEAAVEAGRYAAVQLFVERATAQAPFELASDNVADVVQICRRLDGIPLAIELAAARVRMLSPAQIARRLDDRFRLLEGGSRTALPRHQTLRALIDWSYDLLSEHERALFSRLSMFRGGWTLEAAEVVGSGEGISEVEVLNLLADLIDRSLVIVTHETPGEPRYRMLETIREYSRKRLQEGSHAERVHQRHRDYFLTLAERAGPELRGPKQLVWLNVLEAEGENLRAALEWSRQEQSDAAGELRLANALEMYWVVCSHFNEGRKTLEHALERGNASLEAGSVARRCLALLLHYQGDNDRAIRLAEESTQQARESQDRRLLGYNLTVLACALRRTEPTRAAEALEEALALAREQADHWLIAEALSTLGFHELYHARPERVRRLLEEGLIYARRTGAPSLTAELVYHLGLSALMEQDYPASRTLLEESLTIQRTLGNRSITGATLCHLGNVRLSQGEGAEALPLFQECLSIGQELNYHWIVAASLEGYARYEASDGRERWAVRLYACAAALREAIQAPIVFLWRDLYRRLLDELQAGFAEEEFAALWAQGRALSLDQAISYCRAPGSILI